MTLNASRRAFLQRASALSMAGAAAPFALNLAAMGEAAASTATDYKALVCVFLYGGNDYANTLVNYDQPGYDFYSAARGTLAYARTALGGTALAPAVALPDGRQYALAPELLPLKTYFDDGRMASLLNVGTLKGPTSKADFLAGKNLPPKLFSHNDQQSVWQSSAAEGATSGWGGLMGDVFEAGNGNATFTCVNVSGNAVFLSGNSAVQYQVSPGGAAQLNALKNPLFGSRACSEALYSMVTASRTHLFEAEHTRVMTRSISAGDELRAKLLSPVFDPPFNTDNGLAAQLQMVARMIASADQLQAKRQVFFVSMGGFDTHDGLQDTHPGLLSAVAEALSTFQEALADLKVEQQVTTFTASDFGRTLVCNNDGSDHGWGNMHFVLGGAVKGQRFYGAAPSLVKDGDDDVGQGRLLPSTSVDQMAATLGKWFGLSDSELLTVLPNLGAWDAGKRNLGFV